MHVGRTAWNAAKTALGQPTTGFVAIFAWQAVAASQADTMLTYAETWWTAQGYTGKPFDRLIMAPYTGFALSEVLGNQRTADFLFSGGRCSPGQVLDFLELCVIADVNDYLAKYKAVADAHGYDLGAYEWQVLLSTTTGGNTLESGLPIHNYPAGTDAAWTALYLAVVRDIRAGLAEIATYNIFASYGMKSANYLSDTGVGSSVESGGLYEYPGQVPSLTLENPDLFAATPQPYAPKAGAIRAIAAGQSFTPTAPVRVMPGLPIMLKRRSQGSRHTRYDESCLSVSVLAQGLGSLCGGLN